MEATLVSVSSCQGLLDTVLNLRLGFSPVRSQQLVFRGEAKQSFDFERRIQSFQKIHDKVAILLEAKEPKRSPLIFPAHRSMPDHVQMVQFDEVQPPAADFIRHGEHLAAALPWEAENEMRAQQYSAVSRPRQGVEPAAIIMTAVDAQEGLVVDRLQPVLDRHETCSCQVFEPGDLGFIHAVGAGPDRESHDIGMFERSLIKRYQSVKRSMGIGERLEVDDESLSFVSNASVSILIESTSR